MTNFIPIFPLSIVAFPGEQVNLHIFEPRYRQLIRECFDAQKQFGIPVVPHVGDMGQLHQHLVLFNHIAMGHEALFLEHIPHLKNKFVNPVNIINGVYRTPMEPGSSCDLL